MIIRPELTAALSDRYRITRELGAGGMANVYLAEDVRHHRQVAVKVLRAELASSVGAGRFLREIEIAAGLQHPNILPLFDSGGAGDVLFFVLPFVDGESLRDRLNRGGALPIDDVVRVLRETADALAYAHRRGVIHRDIKPENIMLAGGHALVTDFGIAKALSDAGTTALTATGLAMGTPSYMAPEQAMAEDGLDHRVDLYALGVMAYEMLSGHAPFTGGTAQQIIAGHLTRTPESISSVRPDAPLTLAQLVMRCLEKSPGDRVQSADEIVRLLESLGENASASAAPAVDAVRFTRRSRLKLMAGATFALLIASAVGFVAYTKEGRAGTFIGDETLSQHDVILVAEFQNRNVDSTLAATVTDAVRAELQQSRAVRVMSQQAMWGALTRMQQPHGTALPENIVHDLAEREGAKAYIVGGVEKVGTGYQITARVVATSDGDNALTVRETAKSDAELIGTVEAVGRELRRKIGESLRSVAATAALAQVTTASLPALRAFTLAARAEAEGERPNAIAMARQAIALDTAFASAWSLLYVSYSNEGQVSDATAAITRAYELRSRLSETQALQVEARYHRIHADVRAEEAAWERLAAMGQSETNYANMLMEHGRLAEAEVQARRAVAAQPKSTIALWNLAETQVAQHRFAAGDSTIALARERIPESNYRYWIEIETILGKRDLDSAERYLASPAKTHIPETWNFDCALDITRGRLKKWRACNERAPQLERHFLLLLLADFRLSGDSASVLREIKSFLSAAPGQRDPDSYAAVIALLADVGRVSDARKLMDEWRARAGAGDPSFRADSALAAGAIAAADKQWERAATTFLAWNKSPAVSAVHWYNRGLPEAAEMMRRADKPDSAIVLGERALATSSLAGGIVYESTWYGQLLEMLGDLYAARGDKSKAAEYYRTYLQVMKNAEPPVAAQVASVRERLLKLTGESDGR